MAKQPTQPPDGDHINHSPDDAMNGAPVYLTAGEIIARDDRPIFPIPVPEWGGTVFARPLTLDEQAEHGAFIDSELRKDETHAARNAERITRFLVATLVDQNKRQLFNGTDLAALGKKSGGVLQWLTTECNKQIGLARDSVDDAEKN